MKKTKGFTLVELLIVIAIIAILSTIVLASLDKARSKSRDTKRIADISQIQLALALYLNKNGHYPIGTGADKTSSILKTDLADNKYISEIPTDPTNDSTHKYGYKSVDGTTYCLSAQLENSSTYIDSSITCTTDIADTTYSYRVTK